MAYNQLTGNVIVDLQYRLVQTDASSHVEEHGIIDYDLTLGSGTGNNQANDVWYNDRSFTTNDSIDLSALSLRRFSQVFTTSFLGASNEGNIKGVKVDNKSNESIYVNLPFRNFSGSLEVAASGSILLSNAVGWTIGTGNSNVTISGQTSSNKNYSIGFIGVALPLIVNSDNLLGLEYLASGIGSGLNSPTGTLMLEYLSSGIFTGVMPYEYNIQNSSLDFDLNISYLNEIFWGATGTGTGAGSGTGTMMHIDYLSSLALDGEFLATEWSGQGASTGGGGTGYTELLSNPMILPGHVPYDQIGETGNGVTWGYPGWYASGDYITWAGSSTPESSFVDHTLGLLRYTQGTNIMTARCVRCRGRSYIRQSVTVVPGATYRFTWYPYKVQLGIGQTTYPYIKLSSGAGTTLQQTNVTPAFIASTLASPNNGKHQFDVVATDTTITVEFNKPIDLYPNSSPYTSSNYTTYMSWGYINQATRVSLLRVA